MRKSAQASIGGAPYVLSAVPLGPLRALTAAGVFRTLRESGRRVAAGEEPSDAEAEAEIVATVRLISASLAVRHPECTVEWVEANVTEEEGATLLATILGITMPKMPASEKAEGDGGGNAPSP